VIHAVGPVWHGGNAGEAQLLERAYESSFARARDARDVKSIAFPAISTGIYGFPKREAAEIAIRVMRAHEREFRRVIACVFDAENESLYREVLDSNNKDNS